MSQARISLVIAALVTAKSEAEARTALNMLRRAPGEERDSLSGPDHRAMLRGIRRSRAILEDATRARKESCMG